MTVGISATAANSALDTLLGATPAVTLHTGDPGAAGTANASAGDATKITIAAASASAGSKAMTGSGGPWTNGGTSETLSHISLWITTVFKLSSALSASQPWVSGNTFTLTSLTVALSPIAA